MQSLQGHHEKQDFLSADRKTTGKTEAQKPIRPIGRRISLSKKPFPAKLSSLFFSGIGNRYVGTENYRAFSFPMKEEGSSIGTELKAFLTPNP